MYRCCPSVRPSVPCLLLFTYHFRYVSLNSYGKRNSHSKDREIASQRPFGMLLNCKDGPIAGGPSTAAPSCYYSDVLVLLLDHKVLLGLCVVRWYQHWPCT